MGPDDLPEVPREFEEEIQQQLVTPPPTDPVTTSVPATVPTTSIPTSLPATTAPPVVCPLGRPVISTSVNMSPGNPEGWWRVLLSGTITNDATAPIVIRGIEVALNGTPDAKATATGASGVARLESGLSTTWDGFGSIESPDAEPTVGATTLLWDWSNPAFYDCPKD